MSFFKKNLGTSLFLIFALILFSFSLNRYLSSHQKSENNADITIDTLSSGINKNDQVKGAQTQVENSQAQSQTPQTKSSALSSQNTKPSAGTIPPPSVVDNSYLISYLTGKKANFDSYDINWYNNQKSLLDSTHLNNINNIKQPYLSKLQQCNLYSGSAYDACMSVAEQLKLQAEQSIQNENNSYNQKVADLNNKWDNYKSWSAIIQNLIIFLQQGNKPDANFYNIYYKIPYI